MADDCLLETKKKFDMLEDEELKSLEEEMARLEVAFADDRKGFNTALEDTVTKFADDVKYRSVRVIEDKIKGDRAWRSIFVKGDFKKTAKNLLNLYEGNNSVEAAQRGHGHRYTNQFRSSLKRDGLEKEFFSGEFDKAIYIENFNRANGLPGTKDPRVKKMVDIIKDVNGQIYNDHKAAGLNVKFRNDYLISRNYDSQKLIEAGKDNWVSEMLESYVDLEKTFTKDAIESGRAIEVMGQIYDDILEAQSVHTINDMVGKKSAMNKLKSRKIEFKDGAAEYEFGQKYGAGKRLGESMEHQIDRSAKTVANVMTLGTNAKEFHNRALEKLERAFQDSTDKNEIAKQVSKIQKAYLEVVAPPHQPTTALSKSINMIRGLQAFTKLGSSIFAALYDINSSALQYAVKTGESQFTGYASAFVEGLKSLGNNVDRKDIAEALNVNTWFNDAAVVLGGHRGDYDTGFDKVNRFFTSAQKFTGVPFQTEHSRIVNGILQTRAFNKMLKNADNLNNLQKLSMDEFGISRKDIDFINKYAKADERIGGVTPMGLMDIPLEHFGDTLKMQARNQLELFTKMSNYIDASVQKGTPTPTSKVKRHLMKDRGRDETTRAIANLVMQFKETAWQILLANKEALDKFHQANGVSGAALGVSEYMALGMISYMGIETAKAKLFNQDTPYDKLRKGEDMRGLFMDYINKSSVAPVLSDAVDQGTSPYFGNNITSFIAGPTLGGMLPDAFGVIKSNNKTKAAKRFTKRNILPSNHIGIKAINRQLFEYDFITGEKIRK